jgi:LuxR family maltose regulon positive regulatory protein
MTLVSAPTGWGKTSLLAEWATTTSGVRFAWVSLDRDDDEPLRFWRYLVAALGAAEPALSDTAQRRLRSPVVSIGDEILPVLVNDLAELTEPLVLVLDDFHLIESPQIVEQLDYLVNRQPAGFHVALAAHSDPSMQLGRLRAQGELLELRAEQLQFSHDETAAVLLAVHGLELAPEELAAVQRQTEGWIAGINLTGLSLQRSGERQRVLAGITSDHTYLVDYLWNEVIIAQPARVQDFLLRTAILERLTGSLCDAVAQTVESDELLRRLARANLFVVPLGGAPPWFRYHHLFQDVLVDQLEALDPDAVADLHRLASTWYAEHGLIDEAIKHAIEAGDVHYAADELMRHWVFLLSSGYGPAMPEWIDRLPREAIDAHPLLPAIRASLARRMGRLDEVEPWLNRAEALGPALSPEPARSLASTVALIRSGYRLSLGDVPAAIAHARRGCEIEVEEGRIPYPSMKLWYLGSTLFVESPEEAAPILYECLAALPAGENDVVRYAALASVAEAHVLRGQLEDAERLAQEALQLGRARGLEEYPQSAQVHVALGAVLLARDQPEAAEEQFERAAALAHRGSDRTASAHALLWLARARASHADSTGARAALDAARGLLPDLGGSALRRLAGKVEEKLPDGAPDRDATQTPDALTDAELRVLRLFPGDLTYREMARHLYVSIDTVRTHAQRIRRKLAVSTRGECVTRARQLGLL